MKGKAILELLIVCALVGVASAEETSASAAPGVAMDVKFLAAAIAVGLSGIGAAFAIAKVGVAALGSLVENPKLFGNTILFVAFGEAIAIYGLLVALMILGG